MKNGNPKKKKASEALGKIVTSRLWRILVEQFRLMLEDKEKWEELRLKLLDLTEKKKTKKLPPPD